MPAAVYDRLFTQGLAELKKPRSLALCAMFAALHIVLNQFTIPVSNVLEAQTAWLSAHSERLTARIDVLLADLYLRKALGTLK